MSEFKTRSIPGLFLRIDNQRCIAGHVALFSGRPGHGWAIYSYGEQAPGWALHRRWNFVLFCIHHVGPGKATDPEGWHVTFARLTLKREYQAIVLRWQKADTYRTKRLP